MSNGFACDVDMSSRFLPTCSRLTERTGLMSQPLRSTPTPVSRGFTATTSRSAGGCRLGTQCLRLLPRHAPFLRPAGWNQSTARTLSTLAFSRSVREPQTGLTPPPRRAPPGQYSGSRQAHPRGGFRTPSYDATSFLNDASTATPVRSPVRASSGTSSRSPPDASRAPFPCRSPRRSSANAAQGGLTPAPEGRRRRAIHPPSLTQHRLRRLSYICLLQRS